MDYTKLSLAEVRAVLDTIAGETHSTFGGLGERQLNWRPDTTRWSVAQCFEHLLRVNHLMLASAKDALDHARPHTVWQRLPLVPGLLGAMMIRSQTPGSARKFTAPTAAQPAASALPADAIQRFVEQQRELSQWVLTLHDGDAARAIMESPFLRVITYSVLDGCRLMVAHERRHFEQARRVTLSPGFDRTSVVA